MSKNLYFEWMLPLSDYSEITNKKEKTFENLLPLIGSVLATAICIFAKIEIKAVSKLNDVLPNVLAILIGFSISAISIIVSMNDAKHTINNLAGRTLDGREISFKQLILASLTYYSIFEIGFILLTFIFPLGTAILKNKWLYSGIVLVYSYLLLKILFGTIRIITNLYFVLFQKSDE